MKIYIENVSNTKIGGAWTFLDNFIRSINDQNHREEKMVIITKNLDEADLLFAFAPNTVSGGSLAKAKERNIPIVMRLDGVPEDSRNSGRGTRRLIEHSLYADHLVCQSLFIKRTVAETIKQNGYRGQIHVIYNGVDRETFNPAGEIMFKPTEKTILHVHYRKDPNKRYEEVVQMFREIWLKDRTWELVLVGRYPTMWKDYNFGFFNGEKYRYLGVVQDLAKKALIMRSATLMFNPSYADPAPNTVLEAMASGLPILHNEYGGQAEYIDDAYQTIDPSSYLTQLEEVYRKREVFSQRNRARTVQFDFPRMAAEYTILFQTAINLKRGGGK